MLILYVREGTAIQAFHIFDLALPALGISNPKGLNSRTFSYTERRKLGLIIFLFTAAICLSNNYVEGEE
jgi:hypothetical protein